MKHISVPQSIYLGNKRIIKRDTLISGVISVVFISVVLLSESVQIQNSPSPTELLEKLLQTQDRKSTARVKVQ